VNVAVEVEQVEVLLVVTVTVLDVVELPAASLATAVMVWEPLVTVRESQVME
jgi:hypothetical protein